jgi:pimeloyl-ACP methyl ester carboxylesterase
MGCASSARPAADAAIEALRRSATRGLRDGAAVSYLRSSDPGATRLILVHGTPGSASAWSDYLLDPPAGVEVLALDRPGFGHSGPAGALTSLVDQAAAVVALLPDDDRPVLLLGHSFGGAVVARVAADHPQRVRAIVLLAAALDPALEATHPLQHLGAWAPVKTLLPRVLRNANAELMAFRPELEALTAALPRISARAIIVHGTHDDLVPVANVPYMQARLTGTRSVKTMLLPGRNHFLPWNSQDAVRDAIRLALEPTC